MPLCAPDVALLPLAPEITGDALPTCDAFPVPGDDAGLAPGCTVDEKALLDAPPVPLALLSDPAAAAVFEFSWVVPGFMPLFGFSAVFVPGLLVPLPGFPLLVPGLAPLLWLVVPALAS